MSFVGALLSVIASPLIEGYAEYRKWQLAQQVVTDITNGVGTRVDRVMDGTAALANHSYVRLENATSDYLVECSEYLKLAAAAGTFQLLSALAKISGVVGGCFAQSNIGCTAVGYVAAGTSLYAGLAATVLAGKIGINFYNYCKASSTSPTASSQVTVSSSRGQVLVSARLQEAPSVSQVSEEIERASSLPVFTQEQIANDCDGFNKILEERRAHSAALYLRARESRKLI